ncbi:unnamed protein product [Urochloa humidicola]
MASMIFNASRVAAIAARSAASRCAAAVSRSGSVVAAATDPLLPRRSSLSFYSSRSTVAGLPPFHLPEPAPGRVEFEADEKDLESDEAIWALYERWCKAFNQERTPDEMACRFHRFKQTVLRVDSNKKACLPYTLEINKFADGKMIGLVRPKVPVTVSRDRVTKMRQFSAKFRGADVGNELEGAGEFKKEPEGAGKFKKEQKGEPEGAGEFQKEP